MPVAIHHPRQLSKQLWKRRSRRGSGKTTSPLTVGLCGLGSATLRAHLPALERAQALGQVQLLSACDPSESSQSKLEERVDGVQTFDSLKKLLRQAPPELLIVATPPSSHVEAVTSALESGVHVLCEKPLGLKLSEVSQLAEVANANPDLLLGTVLQYHHAPGWKTLRRVIRGAVRSNQPVEVIIHVERPGTDPLSTGGWRTNSKSEGGIVGDHAVHYVALLHSVVPNIEVISSNSVGPGGAESASVELAGQTLKARITVTYAGQKRRNRILVRTPDQGLSMVWDDDRLISSKPGKAAAIRGVRALSERPFVNDLYVPMYDQLFKNLRKARWRQQQTSISLDVATLLATALTYTTQTVQLSLQQRAMASIGSLSDISRAVLLAFTDLGVYLPSSRERLIGKIRTLDPADPAELEQFIDLCIEANLIAPETAGRLRLVPLEAQQLAKSLDGSGPVPDAQASYWAYLLRTATA